MFGYIKKYTHWLHTQWPAGSVEKMPKIREDCSTSIPGVYVVGDLCGVPLLKFSAHTGARAVQRIVASQRVQPHQQPSTKENDLVDIAIIGAGVSGVAAALEAQAQGLSYVLLESSEVFSTIVNFPKAKPIFTYPSKMEPAGQMRFTAEIKEELLTELQEYSANLQIRHATAERIYRKGTVLVVDLESGDNVRARSVVVAIGRSGNYRQLEIAGEQLDKVYNRLHDPAEYQGKDVLVVGGGDSALETAIALAGAGAAVTLSYRRAEFARAKPENVAALEHYQTMRTTQKDSSYQARQGEVHCLLSSQLREIEPQSVRIECADGSESQLKNDFVFSMIGRDAPLEFFRKSGIGIQGETRIGGWLALAVFLLFITMLYDWKGFGFISSQFPVLSDAGVFPNNIPQWISSLGEWWKQQVADRSSLIGTLAVSMKSRSFYYTLAYTMAILIFGMARIRRRKTPYVTLQTIVLCSIQVLPLFLLPELLLPWAGYNGAFDAGSGKAIADSLFESYISAEDYAAQRWPEWGHPRAYWRAYGFILAWPLMVYNVFTEAPLFWWIAISVVQTFVLIPLLIYRYGKGAYCGWICSCGALAETMGDTQRHKMPHGPIANRWNMLGQGVLFIALLLLVLRVLGWIFPESLLANSFNLVLQGKNASGELVNPLSYMWTIDVLLGGILGVGLYFKYSGRVWCRFACPLAALMHIYTRFSRFRIIPDKKKCISCNLCTANCHQGIDVMSFANKGLPMEDPQCVRCSACVQVCPTGVLQFGTVDKDNAVVSYDRLQASPVLIAEKAENSNKA